MIFHLPFGQPKAALIGALFTLYYPGNCPPSVTLSTNVALHSISSLSLKRVSISQVKHSYYTILYDAYFEYGVIIGDYRDFWRGFYDRV